MIDNVIESLIVLLFLLVIVFDESGRDDIIHGKCLGMGHQYLARSVLGLA